MSANHHNGRMMDTIENRLHRYRAKRLRFLINGDKHFAGITYALNTEKIRSFDTLLNDLTRSLSMDHLKLCKGVRYIFSQDGNSVTNLTDFQDGNTYICSSTDTFIMTEYRINNGMLNWLVRNSACISTTGASVKSKRQLQPAYSNNNTCGNNSSITSGVRSPITRTQASHNNNIINSSSTSRSIGNNISNHNNHSINKNINNDLHGHSSTNNNQVKSSPMPSKHVSNDNSLATSAEPKQQTRTPKKSLQNAHSSQESNISNTTGTPELGTNNSDCGQKLKNRGNSLKNNMTPTIRQSQSKNLFGGKVAEKYDVGNAIGDGHFSVVYCCMNKTTMEFCALKVIDKLKCQGREDMIYNEVRLLKQLSHPNIVKLIEEIDYPKQLYLILELVQDGDLFDAISTVTKFNETHVATMIHNLSSALTYLHKQNIVHRDIKPENLLISVHEDGSQSVKLADFGLAVEVGDDPLYNVCGTAFYVSPEMLNETGYDFKVDVWSCGVICFILLCGYPPFTSENENNQDELFDAILAGKFQFSPLHWNGVSQHAKDLIKSMLTVDPQKRYTAEQVFRDPWTLGTSSNFQGIDPMNISRKIALQSQ